MREIKFRGQRVDNKEWVYGYYVKNNDGRIETGISSIFTGQCGFGFSTELIYERYEVIPSTIGQFTGLHDKNGKEIYEGDIVNMHYFFSNFNQSTFGVFEDEKTVQGVIGIDYIGTFTLVDGDELYWLNYLQEPSDELEVIGNIHEVKHENG